MSDLTTEDLESQIEDYRSALLQVKSALESSFYAPPEMQYFHMNRIMQALQEVGMYDE